MQIIPAILTHNFDEVKEKLSRLDGIVSHVQIDVCDGNFGARKTWLPEGPDGDEILPKEFSCQFDMMVDDWYVYIPRAIAHGASSIVAHVDLFAENDFGTLVTMISPTNMPLGIAVSNDKSIDFHADAVRKVQAIYPNIFIQVMGIMKIGEQGQFFDESTPDRVLQLRRMFSNIPIQVDGGMRPETIPLVVNAGADTVIVGSFLFASEDVGESMRKLELLECNN